jgi:hypothetical protein
VRDAGQRSPQVIRVEDLALAHEPEFSPMRDTP